MVDGSVYEQSGWVRSLKEREEGQPEVPRAWVLTEAVSGGMYGSLTVQGQVAGCKMESISERGVGVGA